MKMNNRVRVLVVFMAILATLSCVSCVRGQLPTSLPIGSLEKFLGYYVTNNAVYISCQITLKDATQSPTSLGFNVGKSFDSLANFETYINSNCWKQYTSFGIASRQDVSAIGIHLGLTYLKTNANGTVYIDDMGSFVIWQTNYICSNQNVHPDSFLSVTPNFIGIDFNIPGIEAVQIDVESDPPYSYTWKPGFELTVTNGVQRIPVTQVLNNTLSLYAWYATNLYRTRITITANGKTETYTQTGASFSSLRQNLNANTWEIYVPPGADASLEYRQSFDEDSPWTSLDPSFVRWQDQNCHKSIPIDFNQPSAFFRVKLE